MKDWTPNELKAYVLIYAMNADAIETPEEIQLIKNKTGTETYEKMYKEFKADDDYNSLEKIKKAIEKEGYCMNQIKCLFNEIKEVFDTNGHIGILERNLTLGLKRTLSY